MVANITSLGRSGLYVWMVQRVTAVVLAAYILFLLGYFVATPDLSYADWSGLFACTAMKIFTLMALISLSAHAWVGMWTISTDYLKNSVVRFLFQGTCGGIMFVYFVWGIQILWGQ